MRRWLALLLLLLLPVQLTWAVVADHRAHMHADAGHGGHHDHAGHADDTVSTPAYPDAFDGSDSAGSADTSAHPDCDHCHGTCAGLPVPASSLASPAPGRSTPAPGDARSASHPPAQPERPQWRRLA